MSQPSFLALQEHLEGVLGHIIQDFMHLMKRHGLSTPQVHVLMYIYHSGQCHMSDITALANVSNAATSQLVERLVQLDLVERREDPANRRIKILRLSEKGKKLIRDSVPLSHFLMDVMSSLSPNQRETIQAAFKILAQQTEHMKMSEKGKDAENA